MSKVAVLDTEKKVLAPCHPAVARKLLKAGKAAVFKRYPFTIILKRCILELEVQATPLQLCIDPGSKTTGIAIVDSDRNVIFAAELHHRSESIKKSLQTRAGFRRGRRTRNLRYRKPRFLNRTRPAGWVAPSLMSRVHNIETWVNRLSKIYPITTVALELVKFDTQLMDNPEIQGVEYQQGTLHGYEVREYLLEKHNRKCAYCNKKDLPLEIEHIFPKALGGTNRISNLTLACNPCNAKKGKQHPHKIKDASLRKKVETAARKAKQPLKDAASVNTIRWKIADALKDNGLPITYGTGGKTKFNRTQSHLPKTHYFDAACVADPVKPPASLNVLQIKAKGYGQRDLFAFSVNKPGFNYGNRKRSGGDGFKKYDHVDLTKKNGEHYHGNINCFDHTKNPNAPRNVRVECLSLPKTDKRISGNTSQLTRIQRRDGYAYLQLESEKNNET